MDIDRFERIWIFISIGVLVLLGGAVAYAAYGLDVQVPADAGQIQVEELRETPPFDKPGLYPIGPDSYRAVIVAQAWTFQPSELRVPSGSTVHFTITSADVIHGFRIPNTTVNLMVVPGQITELSHRFDDPGTYRFLCHEYCGAGHHLMGGELIVERR